MPAKIHDGIVLSGLERPSTCHVYRREWVYPVRVPVVLPLVVPHLAVLLPPPRKFSSVLVVVVTTSTPKDKKFMSSKEMTLSRVHMINDIMTHRPVLSRQAMFDVMTDEEIHEVHRMVLALEQILLFRTEVLKMVEPLRRY